MVRRIHSQHPPKKVVRAMLPSGREVKIYWTDDHVIGFGLEVAIGRGGGAEHLPPPKGPRPDDPPSE